MALINHVKFGADRTFYGWVTTASIPMARYRILSRCHGHAISSSSSQINITKAFRLDWTKNYVDVITFLGGVSCRVKHIHFLLPAGWRYEIIWMWSPRSLQVRSLIKHGNFGAHRTLHAWVITTSCFMAKHRNLTGRHGHALQWKL